MRVLRTSPISGPHTMDLPVTQEQLDELGSRPRRKIQDIFPDLSAPEREFLLTGYTQEDWDAMFGDEQRSMFIDREGT